MTVCPLPWQLMIPLHYETFKGFQHILNIIEEYYVCSSESMMYSIFKLFTLML